MIRSSRSADARPCAGGYDPGLAGKSRADLETDRVLSLAVVRLLEILGEAAGRVPSEVQQVHPSIPWSHIIGMRNRLIHGYDRVDLDIVWSVVVADLPPLVARLEEITAGNGCGVEASSYRGY
jgi:uncharacterized protein with HEPN domain